MSYVKTVWQERIVATANKFLKTGETSSEVTLVNDPGTVTQAGTPFSVTAMNNIEDGVEANDTAITALDGRVTQNESDISDLQTWTEFTPTANSIDFTHGNLYCAYKDDGTILNVLVEFTGSYVSDPTTYMVLSDLPAIINSCKSSGVQGSRGLEGTVTAFAEGGFFDTTQNRFVLEIDLPTGSGASTYSFRYAGVLRK